MNDFDVTGTDFHLMGAVELRKFAAQAGVKGASKGKKADLIAALEIIEAAQLKAAEDFAAEREAEMAAIEAESKPVVKGICGICGVRKMYTGNAGGEEAPRLSEMCNPCFAEGGWENSHSDSNHDAILETPEADRTEDQKLEISGCWICFPELNLAQRAARAGRSRAGMVIIAKGTEIHKSQTFKTAAENAGWSVQILGSVVTDEDGEEIERYVARATRSTAKQVAAEIIELAWNGRAYDYPASSALLNGKSRKVRNLKEALRLLAA
jgi:hypothetical protein